jgi:hypothetical protein
MGVNMELKIDLFKEKIITLIVDIANKNYYKIELNKSNGRVNIMDLERIVNEYNKIKIFVYKSKI